MTSPSGATNRSSEPAGSGRSGRKPAASANQILGADARHIVLRDARRVSPRSYACAASAALKALVHLFVARSPGVDSAGLKRLRTTLGRDPGEAVSAAPYVRGDSDVDGPAPCARASIFSRPVHPRPVKQMRTVGTPSRPESPTTLALMSSTSPARA